MVWLHLTSPTPHTTLLSPGSADQSVVAAPKSGILLLHLTVFSCIFTVFIELIE